MGNKERRKCGCEGRDEEEWEKRQACAGWGGGVHGLEALREGYDKSCEREAC
jgi:hypothetical protein